MGCKESCETGFCVSMRTNKSENYDAYLKLKNNRVCLDVSDEEMEMIKTELARTVYDDYDRLIQLCDSLAGAEGVLDIEDRMNDVKKRYGSYPQDKWDSNMRLKRYFEKKMKKDIYLVCEKDTFVPEEIG